MIRNWHAVIAALIISFAAPSLLGQDFLKQLEEKLQKKQQDPTAPSGKDPAKKESDELPSPSRIPVPNAETLPAPSLLRETTDPPRLELGSPNPKEEQEVVAPPLNPLATPPASTNRTRRTQPQSNVNGLPSNRSTSGNASNALPSGVAPPLPEDPVGIEQGGGGFLGMTVENIPGGGFGLMVVDVAPQSPAWKAGFRRNDQVIGIAGTAVPTVDAFAAQLARFSPGVPIRFLVQRNGKTANLVAVLQDRNLAGRIHGNVPGTAIELNPPPGSFSNPGIGGPTAGAVPGGVGVPGAMGVPGRAYFGVNVSDLSEAFRRQFQIPTYRGASVTEVVRGSPADLAGLKPGDCIVEFDGANVENADGIMDAVMRSRPGQVVSLSYYRGRGVRNATVVLTDSRVPGAPYEPTGVDPLAANDPNSIDVSPDMLTPEYVNGLHNELARVQSELEAAQNRLRQLEARMQQIERNR